MALPKRKKQDTRRYFTEQDEENLLEIAKVLACAATLSGVRAAIESKKASLDLLRQMLGLPVTNYIAIDGIRGAIERVKESAGLEVAIQEVLRAYPATSHSRLLLTVSHLNAGNYSRNYEALLVVQEKTDSTRMSRHGPFMEVVEMKEAKTAIIDRSSAETMTAAVKGLKLAGKGA